jgi:hypothetical protein
VIASQPFDAFPVAAVSLRLSAPVMFLVPRMPGQFGSPGPLDRRLGKLLHDAFRPVKIVRSVIVLQDFIQNFF